jgi:hypothetical protein
VKISNLPGQLMETCVGDDRRYCSGNSICCLVLPWKTGIARLRIGPCKSSILSTFRCPLRPLVRERGNGVCGSRSRCLPSARASWKATTTMQSKQAKKNGLSLFTKAKTFGCEEHQLGGSLMTQAAEQKLLILKFLRSKHNPRSVLIDDNLNLYSFDCLKRGGYVVIDPETGADITRILMA